MGYKTANIEDIVLNATTGDIVDIVFKGLVGQNYKVKDSTKKSGHRKFNMYSNQEDALVHEQNWGSAFLEVVGSGDVEEHKLGYTTENQRVLQVGLMECSYMYTNEIKCNNEAEFLGRIVKDNDQVLTKVAGYKTYCAGCVKKMHDAKRIFPYFNKSFTVGEGDDVNTIVIMGKSSRDKVDFVPTVIDSGKTHDNTEDRDTDNESV